MNNTRIIFGNLRSGNCSKCNKLLERKKVARRGKSCSKYEKLLKSCRATCGKPYLELVRIQYPVPRVLSSFSLEGEREDPGCALSSGEAPLLGEVEKHGGGRRILSSLRALTFHLSSFSRTEHERGSAKERAGCEDFTRIRKSETEFLIGSSNNKFVNTAKLM